jgi:hypothetical protein
MQTHAQRCQQLTDFVMEFLPHALAFSLRNRQELAHPLVCLQKLIVHLFYWPTRSWRFGYQVSK